MTSTPTIHSAFVPIFALRAESKPADGHTEKSIQTEHSRRVSENKTPNVVETRSLIELIGAAIGISGIIVGAISYFKESTLGKWLSGIVTVGGIGAVITGLFNAVDFVGAVANNNDNETKTQHPDTAEELGLPSPEKLFPVTPDEVYINNLLEPSLTTEQRENKIYAYLNNPSDRKNTNILMALVNSPLVSGIDKSVIVRSYLTDKDSLISLLSSEDYILAINAAIGCANRGIQEATEPIYQLLQRDNLTKYEKEYQIDVASSLGRLRDRRATSYLLEELEKDPLDRYIINIIGNLEDPIAVAKLIELSGNIPEDGNHTRLKKAYQETIEKIKAAQGEG